MKIIDTDENKIIDIDENIVIDRNIDTNVYQFFTSFMS